MTDNHVRPLGPLTLEENIAACKNVVNDIHTVYEAVMDKEIDQDSIANLLLGLEHLYELKFQKLIESHNEQKS